MATQRTRRRARPKPGAYVQSLACAYYLTRVVGDIPREEKYRPAVADAVQFLCGMQFLDTNTRHFEDNFRVKMLMGGFHLTPSDGNLRIDATACAVSGLLRYLSCGAETRQTVGSGQFGSGQWVE